MISEDNLFKDFNSKMRQVLSSGLGAGKIGEMNWSRRGSQGVIAPIDINSGLMFRNAKFFLQGKRRFLGVLDWAAIVVCFLALSDKADDTAVCVHRGNSSSDPESARVAVASFLGAVSLARIGAAISNLISVKSVNKTLMKPIVDELSMRVAH
mgnify:CR=1 FL=1